MPLLFEEVPDVEVEVLPVFVSEVLPFFSELDFAFVDADFISDPKVEADVLLPLEEVDPVLPILPEPIDDPEVNPVPDEDPEEVEEEGEPEPLMPEPL